MSCLKPKEGKYEGLVVLQKLGREREE